MVITPEGWLQLTIPGLTFASGCRDDVRDWPAGWCEVCGAGDGELVAMIHRDNHGRITAHDECGHARGYVLDDLR
jgi:hypothetical protein